MILDFANGLNAVTPIAKDRKLIVFVGSGVSVASPSSLPTWDGLLKKFIEFCRDVPNYMTVTPRYLDLINDADLDREKYPIRVASVLKSELVAIERTGTGKVYELFKDWLLKAFSSGQPNENHRAIVKTNYPFILTSNYDKLLEVAAEENNYKHLRAHTFTFKDANKVAASIYQKSDSVIHLHGDVGNIPLDEFVFTAEDYERIKRSYPGFALAIQTLFINYSILFVGYGGSDPHLEEIVNELYYNLFKPGDEPLPEFFLVLKKDKVNEVLSRYKAKLRTTIIALDDYVQTPRLLEEISKEAPRT